MCWRLSGSLDGPRGSTLLMAALESCKGVLNALEVCQSSRPAHRHRPFRRRLHKDLQTTITGTGVELMGARQHMIMAAWAAGVQCWDTVFTNLDDMEGFEKETRMIKLMGFDGKSLVNPRQIAVVHKVFTPAEKEIVFAEKVVREIDDKKAKGHRCIYRGWKDDRHRLLRRSKENAGHGQGGRRV